MGTRMNLQEAIDKNDPKHNRPFTPSQQREYETNFKNLSLVNVPDSFEIDKVSFIESIVSELDNLKINVKETINYFKIYFIKLKKEVNDNENNNKLDIGFTISSSGKNDTLGENDVCWTVENGILKKANNHDEFKEYISWYEKSSIYKEIKTKVIIYEIKDLHNFLLKFFLLQDNKGLEYKMIKFNEIEYEKICLSSHAKDNTNNLSLGYDFGTIYP